MKAFYMDRKIPATMATQHPDNACPLYFTGKRFVRSNEEVEECYRCFSELNVGEYMWDWEGKFVDEAVMDRLYNHYHDYFAENRIGKDIFLTFRIPNIWIESGHKLPRAFMGLLTAERAASNYNLYSPPLFELILPMATSADQLIYLQNTFRKISKATQEIFDMESQLNSVNIIPLFEEFAVIENAKEILHRYVKFLKDEYDHDCDYLRVFTARSDPAVNAGFLPAKIASKMAIHLYHEFSEESGVEVYPWIGGGSLPFRGGINPENLDAVIDEYRGVSTVTVQGAFRYDYDLDLVKKSIARLNSEIPKNHKNYIKLSDAEVNQLKQFNQVASSLYRPVVESVADVINAVAGKLPSHRERVPHVGLFGYSRGVGGVSLPRAIKFTGALYSLGVPPELIGSGRSLKYAKENGMFELINKLCPWLKEDFIHAGHYLNRENLDLLAKDNDVWNVVKEDIKEIESILGIEIGPDQPHHVIHRNFASNIINRLRLDEDFSRDVLFAAEIRKSLG